jgi:hypothetical protein
MMSSGKDWWTSANPKDTWNLVMYHRSSPTSLQPEVSKYQLLNEMRLISRSLSLFMYQWLFVLDNHKLLQGTENCRRTSVQCTAVHLNTYTQQFFPFIIQSPSECKCQYFEIWKLVG